MKKIMFVFGTRPEAIKLCPLVKEFEQHADKFKTFICVTGQHRAMLDQVLKIFNVVPNYDLDLMKNDQTLFDITSLILTAVGKVIREENPDLVLVQGDTTTTVSASLAAYYSKVKIGHVEAGLRTGNKYSPFPEEINRKITTAIADIHFAPTRKARENLLLEGINGDDIVITGNTVIDALLWVRKQIQEEAREYIELESIDFKKRIVLVTNHRRENFGQDFINICRALREIAVSHGEIEVVYPVHLNPNVRKPVYELLSGIPNVKLIEPLEYEPFIYLMDKCYLIISDSGGIQEEAPSLGKPVLVTRNTTERPEAIEAGVVKLVGTNSDTIVTEAARLLSDAAAYAQMSRMQNPYGDGYACKRILDAIQLFLRS